MNVWIVTVELEGLRENVVKGVWSSHEAALAALAECEAGSQTVRCYLTLSVVDDPGAF